MCRPACNKGLQASVQQMYKCLRHSKVPPPVSLKARHHSRLVRAPQVVHPAGEVIKPDSWRCVNDEGMPVHGRPYEKGNLYIHFTVQFPDALDGGTMDALRTLLPPGAASASLNGRMETEDIEQARPRASRVSRLHMRRAGRLAMHLEYKRQLGVCTQGVCCCCCGCRHPAS